MNLFTSYNDEYNYIKKQPNIWVEIISIEKSFFGYPKYVKLNISSDFRSIGHYNDINNIIIKGALFIESELHKDKIMIYIKYDIKSIDNNNNFCNVDKIQYISYFPIQNKKIFLFVTYKDSKSLSI